MSLNDEANGNTAEVVFNGTLAQTMTGAITAVEDGEGAVEVNNSAGVTLGGNVGTNSVRVGRLSLGSNTRVTLNGQVFVGTLAVGTDAASAVVLGGTSSRNGTTVIDASAVSGAGTVMIQVGTGVLSVGESLTLVRSAGGTVSGLTFNADGSDTASVNYTISQSSPGVITLTAASPIVSGGSLETTEGVSTSTNEAGQRVVTLAGGGLVVSRDATLNVAGGTSGGAGEVIEGTGGVEVMTDQTFTLQVGQAATGETQSTNPSALVLAVPVNASGSNPGRVTIQTNANRTNNLTLRANSAMEATDINLGGGEIALMGSNDTLTFAGSEAQTLTGNITGSNGSLMMNNTSQVRIDGEVAVNRIIHTMGVADFDEAVTATEIELNAPQAAQFAGDVQVTTVVLGTAGQMRLDGSGEQTVTGTVSAGTANQGTVTVSNMTGVTFNGAMGTANQRLGGLMLVSGAQAQFRSDVQVNEVGLGADAQMTLEGSGVQTVGGR